MSEKDSPPGFSILGIPVTILQLTDVLPSHFPVWYHLCQMGVAMIEVAIAVWIRQIYPALWYLGHEEKDKLRSNKRLVTQDQSGYSSSIV